MEEVIASHGGSGHGGHFMVAVTGSRNSEYLIRWTDSTTRRLNATWTALHVRSRGQDEDQGVLERNLSLAKDLGAEIISVADNDVAACIIRHARIKKATALVIGKADDAAIPFIGRNSVMEDILRESGDLDIIILRGKSPVPPQRRRFRRGVQHGIMRGSPVAALSLSAVTILGLVSQPALGYRSISILYLLTIISLPFACGRIVVFAAALVSALLWNFLFIPPRLTFSIASLEDMLMFLAFFLAAFVGGFLTSRLKEKESALSLRERRMAFLYGFTRSIARIRGIDDVVGFFRQYLAEHLMLDALVVLPNQSGDLAVSGIIGRATDPELETGFAINLARRCFTANECIADGDHRLYIPLGAPESVLGVLFVSGKDERTIQGESHDLLATLAGNMALALERELLAAENERNKMAGESARLSRILLNHVSHELRTPLTTIKGSVSGLLDGITAEDPQLRSMLLMETMIAADKLNILVEDLLAMSRLEAGKLRPRPEVTYVSELIGAAQLDLGQELAGRQVVLDRSSQDAEIEVDPALMVQVFRNILRNFITYTAPGSLLHIAVEKVGGNSVIRCADNGPGVTDQELPLLFDTFYRGSKATSRQGCGLGLSICRGIIEVHGGTLEADRSKAGGLCLVITLPGMGSL
jgi:two-component system sensor histidine kinase KdpD